MSHVMLDMLAFVVLLKVSSCSKGVFPCHCVHLGRGVLAPGNIFILKGATEMNK